jgi:hypothetical protein
MIFVVVRRRRNHLGLFQRRRPWRCTWRHRLPVVPLVSTAGSAARVAGDSSPTWGRLVDTSLTVSNVAVAIAVAGTAKPATEALVEPAALLLATVPRHITIHCFSAIAAGADGLRHPHRQTVECCAVQILDGVPDLPDVPEFDKRLAGRQARLGIKANINTECPDIVLSGNDPSAATMPR